MENTEQVSTTTEATEVFSVETPVAPIEETQPAPPKEEKKLLPEPEWSAYVDTPMTPVRKETPSNVYVDMPKPAPAVAQKKARGVDSAIEAISNNTDPLLAFDQAYVNPEGSIEARAENLKNTSINVPLGLAGQVPADAIAADVKGRKERAETTTLGPYYAWVDTLPDAALLSKREKDDMAYYAWMNNTLAKTWDEMSKTEVAGDLLQTMVVGDNNFRVNDIAKFLGVPTEAGDYLNTVDLNVKMANAFSKLPVEARATLLQEVADSWETMGLFDNKLELMTFMSRMVSIDDFERTAMFVESASDVADQAIIGKFVGGKIWGTMAKATGILPRLAKLKRIDAVRDVAKLGAAAKLKPAGVDPLTAANTMVPMSNMQKLTVGAPKEVADKIMGMEVEMQKIAEGFDPLDLPLTPADRTKRIESAMDAARLEPNVVDVRVVRSDGKTFELETEMFDGMREDVTRRSQTIHYTINDVGAWEESQQTAKLGEWVWSPNHRLAGIKEDIVQSPHLGLLQGTRIRSAIDDFVKTSLGPLNKRSMRKVDGLLLRGDGESAVYSYAEAVEHGIGGVKYTDKEYQAYANTRQIFDTMHYLTDKRLKAQWAVKGIREVDINGVKVAGKVYDEAPNANLAMDKATKHSKWYIQDGKLVAKELTKEIIDKAYTQGYKLIHADSAELFELGTQAAEWAFVKNDGIKVPTGFILNRVPGYVSKIRVGANFFLKRKVKRTVGHKEVERLVTERYSSNYADLEKYRKGLDNADEFVVMADRQMTSSELEMEHIRIQGGLFTGSRKSSIIPYGVGEVEGARRTALDSLQSYINNVATSMPMAIYRDGLKQKWINSAKEAKILKGYNGSEGFADLVRKIDDLHPKARFFRQSHNEVSFISGVKTSSETSWATNSFKAGRYVEGIPVLGMPMARILYSDTIQNIPSTLKTVTYHTMLGLYTPAQLYIQASGALLAFSANPVHATKGFAHALEFALLDVLGHKKNVNALANTFDLNSWKLWDKSGMREGVLSTNLDYNSVFSHAPYDAGFVRKVAANSDIFVKSGEMIYSRIAFGTAYDYMKKKLNRVPTEDDLPAIIARADQYRLNMSKANTAKFQKGLAGIPTQFMQVQTKFLEKLMGKDFTRAERARIVAGQAVLLGAAGAPIVGTLAPPILDYLGINSEELDSETLAVLQRGAVGYAMTDMLHTNAEFSGRLSLGSDIMERLVGAVVAPSLPAIGDLAMGPSWSLWTKSTDVFQRLMCVNSLLFSADQMSDTDLLSAGKVIGEQLLQIPASTRNAMKGYIMWNSGMYRNAQGLPVFHYKDPSWQAALAQAVGFQNREVQDWYDLGGEGKFFENKATVDSYAKTMASTMLQMIEAGADEQMVMGAAYNAMLTAALNQNGGDKVLKQTIKLLKKPGTTWNERMVKGLQKYQQEYTESLEELISVSKIRTNVTLSREMEKYGVKK